MKKKDNFDLILNNLVQNKDEMNQNILQDCAVGTHLKMMASSREFKLFMLTFIRTHQGNYCNLIRSYYLRFGPEKYPNQWGNLKITWKDIILFKTDVIRQKRMLRTLSKYFDSPLLVASLEYQFERAQTVEKGIENAYLFLLKYFHKDIVSPIIKNHGKNQRQSIQSV